MTAFAAAWLALSPAAAQEAEPGIDDMLAELGKPDLQDWETLEQRIYTEWSKSGSPAMDLLLQRGREAIEAGRIDVALEHLTALTDHAPEFAEGWNARATAFYRKGRYGLAIADIRRTLALNPRHFGALTGLALILEQLGYKEDALEAWRAVEAIHPHRPELQQAIKRLETETGGASL